MAEKVKPKILIVDNSVALTGALKAILNSCRFLKDVFTFYFVLPESSMAAIDVRQEGYIVDFLPFVEISKRFNDLILYIPILLKNSYRLAKIAKQYQIDIIHMNDFFNLTGIIAKKLGAAPFLITHVRFLPHRFPVPLAKFWVNINLKSADQIICVSEAVFSFFPSSSKVHIIYDSIPLGEKHSERIITSNKKKELQLLYLANYINGKGHNFAIEAFKKAYALDKRLRLKLIGGDMGLVKNRQFKEKLKEQVKQADLTSVVSFNNFISDVEKALKAADIFLNFSESESLSLTCLDALYYGTPLIASDCGGPAELFENGKSGYLVPNKDVDSMARAIIDLADDEAKRVHFSQEGKRYVRHKFRAENTYLKLQKLYLKILDSDNK